MKIQDFCDQAKFECKKSSALQIYFIFTFY